MKDWIPRGSATSSEHKDAELAQSSHVESQAGTDGGPQKIIHGRVQTYFALETNATLIRDGSTWEILGVLR